MLKPLQILCGIFLSASLVAQTPYTKLSATELVHAYVEHTKVSDTQQQDFTFTIFHRDINYIHDKLSHDETYKSESIFIGGLPYLHRIEHNGKPLKGKELQHEQDLYDKTIRERTGLTDDTRWALSKNKHQTVKTLPTDQLETGFHAEIAGRQILDGHECIVLEFTPLEPDAPPALQRHARLALDASNLNVLTSWVEFLAADSGFSKGTVMEAHNTYIDGVLLPASTRFDTVMHASEMIRKVDIHLIGTDDFSNYRRFRASVILKPGPMAENSSTQSQPQ